MLDFSGRNQHIKYYAGFIPGFARFKGENVGFPPLGSLTPYVYLRVRVLRKGFQRLGC